MRYAILSDVHSNQEALVAVLAALAADPVDRILCGGDLVGYAAAPESCIAQVRARCHAVVAGNHDWAAIGKLRDDWFHEAAQQAVRWTAGQVSADSAQYLASLPLTWQDDHVTVAHGTLHAPEAFHYLLDDDAAEQSFAVQQTPVAFVGHTHVPVIFMKDPQGAVRLLRQSAVTLTPGAKYLVNVGSVGQPRDHDPRAAYGLYDTDRRQIEIKRVAYPVAATQAAIRAAGLPARFADRLARGA